MCPEIMMRDSVQGDVMWFGGDDEGSRGRKRMEYIFEQEEDQAHK